MALPPARRHNIPVGQLTHVYKSRFFVYFKLIHFLGNEGMFDALSSRVVNCNFFFFFETPHFLGNDAYDAPIFRLFRIPQFFSGTKVHMTP